MRLTSSAGALPSGAMQKLGRVRGAALLFVGAALGGAAAMGAQGGCSSAHAADEVTCGGDFNRAEHDFGDLSGEELARVSAVEVFAKPGGDGTTAQSLPIFFRKGVAFVNCKAGSTVTFVLR